MQHTSLCSPAAELHPQNRRLLMSCSPPPPAHLPHHFSKTCNIQSWNSTAESAISHLSCLKLAIFKVAIEHISSTVDQAMMGRAFSKPSRAGKGCEKLLVNCEWGSNFFWYSSNFEQCMNAYYLVLISSFWSNVHE